MKIFLMITLTFLTTTSFASTTIRGAEAEGLFNDLVELGAFVDSGAGQAGTTSQSLECVLQVDMLAQATYTCSLMILDLTGGLSPVALAGAEAQRFYTSLIGSGIANSTCTPGACRIELESIDCLGNIGTNDQGMAAVSNMICEAN